MSLKPSPKTGRRVSASEFAKLIGRTREHVHRLEREGTLPPLVDGKFELVAALLNWCAYLEARLGTKTNADERIKAARAEKLELQNSATKRDTIPADEVRRDVTRLGNELRTQLMTIPRRVAQTLALESDPVAVEERIQAELVSVLELLSKRERASDLMVSKKQDSEK